jgi:hypothetical protein
MIGSVEQHKSGRSRFAQFGNGVHHARKVVSDFEGEGNGDLLFYLFCHIEIDLFIFGSATIDVRRKYVDIQFDSIGTCLLNAFCKIAPVVLRNTVDARNNRNG